MGLFFRKKRTLKGKSDFLEPEEILFNKEALSQLAPEEDMQRLELAVGQWGIKSISYWGLVFLIATLAAVFYFSIIRGSFFRAAAEKNSLKFISIPAERGLIYDRQNKPLVVNKPVFDLVFFPNYLPSDISQRNELFNKIQDCCSLSMANLEGEITKAESLLHSIILKPNLTNEQAIALESNFGGSAAVQVIRQNIREYQNSYALSHVLGYLGRVSAEDLKVDPGLMDFERIGKTGLEAQYENELRGKDGNITILRDAAMNILGQSSGVDPQPGLNLHLTIDVDLQNYLYQRLKTQIDNLGGDRGGVALVMDSDTGEILSFVSYPGFDSNGFSIGLSQSDLNQLLNSKSKPLFNRAIDGQYNPGSTLKPLIAIAGLEENLIDPDKKIETHGFLSVPNPYFPGNPSIFLDWKNQGYVNMKDALARSSDVYFYILGGGYGDMQGLGIDRIGKYLAKFQFNSPTGIDLPGENVGFIPSPANKKGDPWRIGDTYHTAIGQGDLLVTPVRLLVSLNSLINGGKVVKPYLVQAISDSDGKIIQEEKPTVVMENFLKAENLAVVKEGMRQTVATPNGTGYTLNSLPFRVGGKSGTAQVANNTKENALFFAFSPVDHPKISMLVLIENSKEGSLNAIPVVKDSLLWYYQNRGL